MLASDAIAEEQQLAVEMEGLDDEVGRLNFCLIISNIIILLLYTLYSFWLTRCLDGERLMDGWGTVGLLLESPIGEQQLAVEME